LVLAYGDSGIAGHPIQRFDRLMSSLDHLFDAILGSLVLGDWDLFREKQKFIAK
jgi:hypothetical protein